MKKFYILAGLFVTANIADILLTWLILGDGGVELNPIMAFFIEAGFWKSVLFKVGLPLVVASVLIRNRRLASLAILTVAFTGIAVWNATWVLL